MPKLTRNFLKGHMNKDLDERLVPKGEYRDAQNIQISTSEGSDVGAVENMLSNVKQITKVVGGDVWDTRFGLTSPIVIGAERDTENNKIYWFITSSASNVDAILEYDEATKVIAPIIVDARTSGAVLNFNSDYLITGINIIDGLLFFTDDLNEPRVINIADFKTATAAVIGTDTTFVGNTTEIYSREFLASDITVIKKKPNTAPSVTALSTSRSGSSVGLGLNTVTATYDFTELFNGESVPLEVGSSVTFTVSSAPNWLVNDFIVLTASDTNDNNFEEEYQVRIKLTATPTSTSIQGNIQSISSDLKPIAYEWTCVLEEEKPMFEFEFPRFAYRWKYYNNEYSAFSPWTQAVFVPANYNYNAFIGENKSMSNNLRKLTLNNFETPPANVERVEILYKDSNNTEVYKVDDIAASTSTFSITSELIYHVINSNQSIRPYDNVPIKAKAQEVIGNRVVYGNYVQNYDVPADTGIFDVTLFSQNITNVKSPNESIKTDRTYQIGIVYLDEFGRETPVFTGKEATLTIPKKHAPQKNQIQVDFTLDGSAPPFATHFKYYIKDNSSEYYNLPLDRFYAAEDGNVWLSIPSSDRNKLIEGDILSLKKKHNSNSAASENAKYKILDISNEAPRYIRTKRTQVSFSGITKGTDADAPAAGKKRIVFVGPDKSQSEDFMSGFKTGRYVRFQSADGTSHTDFYEIQSGGFLNNSDDNYEIILDKKISDDDGNVFPSGSGAIFGCEIWDFINKNLSEYEGRFFVKIERNVTFDENIIYNFTNDPEDYEFVGGGRKIDAGNTATDDPDTGTQGAAPPGLWFWDEHPNADIDSSLNFNQFSKPTLYSKKFGVKHVPYNATDGFSSASNFVSDLAAGDIVQFKDSVSGLYGKIYEVESVSKGTYDRNYQTSDGTSTDDDLGYYMNITLATEFSDIDFDVDQVRMVARKRLLLTPFDENTKVLPSSNPAIFETEPIEKADLNLYYEATDAIPIANIETNQFLNYFNCISFGNGVESNRIKDAFNAKTISKGVKVSATLDEPYQQERRKSGLIYSGIYNTLSGVNETNQFIAGLKITKDLNPVYGSIQKLSARGAAARGDLVVLCEDKVFKILANKDALFNADGNANLTASTNVLGQAIPFAGEYGISTQPESFASFGFRSYFCDRKRRAVLRLSADGLTVISDKGLKDYFRDEWTAQVSNKIFGGYDEYTNTYHAKVQGEQVLFSETVNGWVTRTSWVPQYSGISLNNIYYTFKNGELYSHNGTSRNTIYDIQESSSITAVLNDMPTAIKNFKTLEYQGDAEWTAEIITDQEKGTSALTFIERENLYQNYIKGTDDTWDNNLGAGNIDFKSLSILGIGRIAQEVEITGVTDIFNYEIDIDNAISIGDRLFYQDGNTIKEIGTISGIELNTSPKTIRITNAVLQVGTLINTSAFTFVSKNQTVNTSGLIGYYADVKFSTGNANQRMELFGIGSEVFISSE